MMKKHLVLIACLIISIPASAQYPGGINTGLKVWLKANSGITPGPTNTVTVWNELSGANVTGNMSATVNPFTLAPPTYNPAGLNFNPHVVFVQNNGNSLSSTNQFTGNTLLDPTNNTVLEVIRVHNTPNTGVWLKWQFLNTSSFRLGNEYNTGNTGRIRFDWAGTMLLSTTPVTEKYCLANMTTEAQKTIRLNGALDATGPSATFNPPATPGRFAIGGEPAGTAGSTEQYYCSIDYAEVIIFSRILTVAERNKVESYLAVKYGFTLDQGAVAANDYTSSTGSVTWSRTANLPFVNNITGIGRDDGDSLIQRQSKSINTTGMVTIYNGSYTGANFPATNTGNANNFTANNSYLLFGDNALATNFNRCFSATGMGFTRMPRIWKAQTTGTIGTVTLAVNAADVPANTRHLLVSTDTAFAAANTTIYRLDIANGSLSKSITLPNNSYFTYASDTLVAHPTSNSPLCQGTTLQLNSNIAGLTSYSWTGPNSFSSTVQNPSIVGATSVNAGYYVLNGSIAGCSLKPDSVRVIVSTKPAPPTVITPIYYCAGDLAAPLTATGNGLKWYSTPVGGTGTTTPPIPNTAYEDSIT